MNTYRMECTPKAIYGVFLLTALLLASPTTAAAWYQVVCSAQPQPVGFTFDGYPSFNGNFCYGHPVWSNDGKNTYNFNPGGNAHRSNSGYGYQCMELAERYFYFRWGVSVHGAAAKDLCPGGSGGWSPQADAQYTSTPVPGDLAVFSAKNSCGFDHIYGHIDVVNKVYSDGTMDTVNQDWGSSLSPRYAKLKQLCACKFIHAKKNPGRSAGCSPADAGGPGSGAPTCRTEPYALATYYTGPAAALDGAGQLVVFVRGTDGQLYYKYQKGANGGYPKHKTETWDDTGSANDGWTPIPGADNLLSDPVVATHNYISSSGSANGSFGGQLPAGELDVFYIGTDNQIWHVWQNARVNPNQPIPPVNPKEWSQPQAIGGKVAGQVGVLNGMALFYVDDYQTIYTIYRKIGYTTSYDPTRAYSWSTPKALTKKLAASTNITPVYTPDNQTYLFFAGADKSIQKMSNQGNVGLAPGASGWSVPSLATKDAGAGPGAATSNITAAWDASGGIAVFYRGPNHAIWEIPPTGTYTGPNDICQWCSGTFGTPHPVPGTESSSDITIGPLNGYLQVYYRNAEGGLQSQKQVGLPDPLTHDPRWYKAFNLVGNYGPNVKKNTTALPYLNDSIFSIPGHGYNQNLRNEIFYIGTGGNLYHIYELKTPQLATTPPYTAAYPSWSIPESLGNPVAPTSGGGGLAGYNPYCDYLKNGGPDAAGLDFIAKWEGTISGCYCDPLHGCGRDTTWGIGTLWTTRNSCTVGGHTYNRVCPNSNPCGQWVSYDDCNPATGSHWCSNSLPACDVPASDFPACAESVLQEVSLGFMKELNNVIPCSLKLTQNQFDALADVAYNCGPGMGGCVGPIVRAMLSGSPPYQQAASIMYQGWGRASRSRAHADGKLFCTGSADPANGIPACTVP